MKISRIDLIGHNGNEGTHYMSDRRSRPPNKFGCKPTEDVCVEHDMPLECKHGCKYSKEHKCKELGNTCEDEGCPHFGTPHAHPHE